MLNEIEEFKAYTQFPKYNANGKRDMSFLGRFTFDMLIKQIGLHRVLTIIARGYMLESKSPDVDCAKGALQAWCSLPTEKKDDWKANTNFNHPAVGFTVMFTTSAILSKTTPVPSVRRQFQSANC